MATLTKTGDAAPDARKIVSGGAVYIVDKCAGYEDVYPAVREAFFESVGELAGEKVEAGVRRDGLGRLHTHFPTEKVLMIEDSVRLKLKDTLYHWSYRIGRDDLGLADPFYIDHLIVIRVHFPFEVARQARQAERPARANEDFIDHALSAVKNPRILVNQAVRATRRAAVAATFEPGKFHGDLVKPAQSHGAHIDTWYGHSYDGINLWWSIEGVNTENTIILYPEMFARPVDYDPAHMYLAPGQQVGEPHQVDLRPGQLLLFNPEMLHSTQVNVSDETRVALTTRINPGRPKFNDKAPFNFEHWHSSTNLAKRQFQSLQVFPAAKNRGEPAWNARPALAPHKTKRLERDYATSDGPACRADELVAGEKVAIDFFDAKLMLWREASGEIKAYSRLCPHVGVDLVDGWHDDDVVHCPGHGLRFNWEDGQSNCASFKLRAFSVSESDGQIFVARARQNRKSELTVAEDA